MIIEIDIDKIRNAVDNLNFEKAIFLGDKTQRLRQILVKRWSGVFRSCYAGLLLDLCLRLQPCTHLMPVIPKSRIRP